MFNALRFSDHNLILSGYSGYNQPRIGRQLATKLTLPFVDLDQKIEQHSGYSVKELRERFGGKRLETIVAEVMQEMILYRQAVLRVSGSSLLLSDYFEQLKRTGTIVCIYAQLGSILQKLHLTLGARYHDPAQRAFALADLQREWQVTHLNGIHTLDVTYLNEEEIIQEILNLWQQVSLART